MCRFLAPPQTVAVAWLVLVPLLLVLPAQAQDAGDREAVEARLESLKAQIEEDRQRLSETLEVQEASEEELNSLDRQIALRRELIATYQRRLDQLNAEEDSLQASLGALQARVEQLKEEYQARATHAYKYGRLHDIALILAAQSINQMLVRVRYLHRFAEERRGRLEAVQEAGRQVEAQQAELAERRARTLELLEEADREQRTLTQLQSRRRQVIQELRAQTTSIQQEISQKEAAAERLESRLRQMIAAANRRAPAETASPEDMARFRALTGSFQENQGRLPWPAEGVVTEAFGTLVNPVHGTRTPNPGILIATRPQAEVRAVFDGEVTRVDALPDLGTVVFVRHGEYTSVYGNFSMLYVGQDQRVSAGQIIGRAGTDGEPRGAAVFFALFRSGEPFDPEAWLTAR